MQTYGYAAHSPGTFVPTQNFDNGQHCAEQEAQWANA